MHALTLLFFITAWQYHHPLLQMGKLRHSELPGPGHTLASVRARTGLEPFSLAPKAHPWPLLHPALPCSPICPAGWAWDLSTPPAEWMYSPAGPFSPRVASQLWKSLGRLSQESAVFTPLSRSVLWKVCQVMFSILLWQTPRPLLVPSSKPSTLSSLPWTAEPLPRPQLR